MLDFLSGNVLLLQITFRNSILQAFLLYQSLQIVVIQNVALVAVHYKRVLLVRLILQKVCRCSSVTHIQEVMTGSLNSRDVILCVERIVKKKISRCGFFFIINGSV